MSYKFRNLIALTIFTFTFAIVNTMAQTRAYTATDSQVQYLLNRIETRTDTFKRNMDTALDQSRLNNTNSEDMIADYITQFENSTDALKQKFDARRSVSADVSDVLNRAANINQFMRNNRLNSTVQSSWLALRTDLTTLARYYRVSFDWNAAINNDTEVTTRPYRVTDATVSNLLTRIEQSTDRFRRVVERSINRSNINNTNREDNINQFISDFENRTDELKRKFDSRTSIGADVSEVLNQAAYIERFMRNNRLNAAARREWTNLKNDLNTLAGYYSVSWNWNNNPNQNPNQYDRFDLNGTYRLNTAQSDNVSTVISNSTDRYYTGNQRDRVRQNLERRLTPPDMLAIESVGRQITMGSNMAQQVSFTADGVTRTETLNNGRTMRVTASSNTNNAVTLNYEGDRMNDFYVTFEPLRNGQLRVTRRIYLENRNETITVTSVYDKINPTAQWSVLNNNQDTVGNVYDRFVVPNNTRMTAVLQNMISTKTSQENDRFQLLVTSPSQYEGAVIEGYVSKTERSGRVTGRANVQLVFDTIRLRNGQTYRFAGLVDEVRKSNGDTVAVNNEGAVRDNSQTNKTITRGAIGAGIGAIIGAIVGGGKGAAVGAVIGGGAGAGSVLIQGRDDVELESGTEFRLTSTAPGNLTSSR